ncbi:MAG: SIMPL domain-containing protein [Clostridia bacterium]|nr:SIMPL domain-containing protein [Clostridia bacterium]
MKWILKGLAVCLAMVLLGCAALAETEISTTGEGHVMMDPDRAVVTLGVEQVSDTVAEGQADVNERVASIRAALAELGVDPRNITVSDLSIYTYSDYGYEDEQGPAEYQITHTLDVTLSDPSQAGAVIDAAIEAGANRLNSVYFSVSDGTEAYRQALAMAVEDARAKAEVLSAAAGLELDGLKSLYEGSESNFGVDFKSVSAELATGENDVGVPTELNGSRIAVTAAVTATWACK